MAFEVQTPTPDEWQELAEIGKRAVSRAVELMAIEVWGNIAREAPVDEGRLAGSFALNQTGEVEWTISTAVHYAAFVHEGTGIYGPTGSRIVPTSAAALAFEWMGELWIVSSVAGQEPNPYADRAIASAGARAQEFASMAVEEVTT